jgi:ABC-2 type transport system ATP-binding protein
MMGASRYVGRVGGLAVALGVGAAMFSGSGLASADTVTRGADSTGASNATESSASPAARNQPSARRANPGASRGAATRSNDRARSASPQLSAPSITAPAAGAARRAAALAVVDPESPTDSVAAEDLTVVPPAVELPEPAGPDIRVHIDPMPDPLPEPVEAYEVTAFLSEADNDVSDGADTDPLVPADPLASGELLAFVRRNTLGTATTNAVAPQVTSSATVTSGGLTANPTVTIDDGIIQGYLEAVSSRGLTMTYTALGATCGSNCALGDLGGKISLGTIPLIGNTAQSFTILPYANWLDGGSRGSQTFDVRIREVTDFDMFLTGIPLVGMFAAPIIDLLQTLPLISDLLAPIIGSSVVATINVDVADLAPGETPVAFTYRVVSFDGVDISTNFFPKAGLLAGQTAPTVINMPGLASAGLSNPYSTCGICGATPKSAETLGVKPLRDNYNVVTVTPRGEFNSGGILQLDNPFFEGRDVSAVIDFIAAKTPAESTVNPDLVKDPKVGMVGGSYGGGIQLTAAATDPRIDAIVPDIAWNSLNSSLYPDNTFKTAYGSLLYLSLLTTGARVNSQIPRAILTGDLLGWITETAQAVLASSGPTALLNQLQAPTLLTQGIVDVLFPLQQSLISAQTILGNLFAPATKVIWFCGGHGVCNDPISDLQEPTLRGNALAWLDQYVKGDGTAADAIPNFQWFDQLGEYYFSNKLPYEAGFNDRSEITGEADGGLLPIVPFFGGSNGLDGLPYSLGGGEVASNAINVSVTVGANTQVVGTPKVTFTYQGLGTTRAVYAQVVDNSTGQVLGNIVTPLPVTLDGREHTQTFDLSDIVYTYGGATNPGSLTVQITSSATAFENFTSFGLMNISNVQVTMPNRNVPD